MRPLMMAYVVKSWRNQNRKHAWRRPIREKRLEQGAQFMGHGKYLPIKTHMGVEKESGILNNAKYRPSRRCLPFAASSQAKA
jgi:hypothetical protein